MQQQQSGGLVIGRFIPPHEGHDFLINQAFVRSQERVTVMIMARKDEKIPGYLREQWLKAAHPQSGKNIVLVENDLPEDYNDPFVWDMWVNLIKSRLSYPVHTVYSSEMYGDDLARRLQAKHDLIDLSRENKRISATMLRTDLESHKVFLRDEVYEWMKKHQHLFEKSPSARFEKPPVPGGPA